MIATSKAGSDWAEYRFDSAARLEEMSAYSDGEHDMSRVYRYDANLLVELRVYEGPSRRLTWIWTTTYDRLGRVVRTLANGPRDSKLVVSYYYEKDKLIMTESDSGADGTIEDRITNLYKSNGVLDRVVHSTPPHEGAAYILRYLWDDDRLVGDVEYICYDGTTVLTTLHYDEYGNLASAMSYDGDIDSFYGTNGLPTAETLSTYDDYHRLIREDRRRFGEWDQTTAWTYDPSGRLQSKKVEAHWGPSISTSYEYDCSP